MLNIEAKSSARAGAERELRLVRSLVEAIRSLPDADAKLSVESSQAADAGYDAEITARVGTTKFSLFVEAKSEIYPRDAREQITRWAKRMENTGRKRGSDAHLLIAADLISDGAKELLVSHGIGFFAEGGSLCMPVPGAYVYIDRPAPQRTARSISSVFTAARSQALHALLLAPESWVSVKELAERSGASPGTVSSLLQQLEQLEWVESEGRGPNKLRRLVDPGALLTAWAEDARDDSSRLALRRFFVPGVKAADLPARIAKKARTEPPEYEITGEAAAQHYAPFLTSFSVTTARMLAEHIEDAIAALGAKEVAQGANLHIIESHSAKDFLLTRKAQGIAFASPVRAYLDLVHGTGRSKEAAEHLREQVLKF